MKMNKTKIIVPTLALAMGAALAGSVSGTVAWFQYSTRAQAAYIGTTAHCSEALEIQVTSVDGEIDPDNWKTELKASDVAAVLNVSETVKYGTALSPITTGAMEKTGSLPVDTDSKTQLYANPIYQHFAYSEWEKATIANYAQFDLHFRVKDVNATEAFLAKDVYLQNLSIVSLKAGTQANTVVEDNTSDLYKAVRVHIASSSKKALFANNGVTGASAADIETITSSKLDLNNDGDIDTTAAYSDWQSGEEKFYGGTAATDKQVAYNVNQEGLFADDSTNPVLSADNNNIGTLGSLGQTVATGTNLKVTVTIWFEGWQLLPDGIGSTTNSAIWEPATYLGKQFGVGMRFVVSAHEAH